MYDAGDKWVHFLRWRPPAQKNFTRPESWTTGRDLPTYRKVYEDIWRVNVDIKWLAGGQNGFWKNCSSLFGKKRFFLKLEMPSCTLRKISEKKIVKQKNGWSKSVASYVALKEARLATKKCGGEHSRLRVVQRFFCKKTELTYAKFSGVELLKHFPYAMFYAQKLSRIACCTPRSRYEYVWKGPDAR